MISKYDYLRNRPFLVIQMLSQPATHVRTERRGWMGDAANIRIIEHPSLVTRISHATMRQATVIIDIINDVVIKNRLRDDATAFDDEVLDRYKIKCADMIEQAHAYWSARQ